MDYKEKYNAALERAKKLQETCDSTTVVGWCEYIFPELKESKDKKIKREILELVSIAGNGNQFEEIKDWLEKQDKWRTEDKLEPKFNEGDWIIFNGLTLYVKEVVNGFYRTISKGGITNSYDWDIDNIARLWTIEDAKDGDVLVASDGSIFLFAGVDDCACKYYVALTTDNHVEINKGAKDGYWETSRAVHPATKEQRDLLSQKMADAGTNL